MEEWGLRACWAKSQGLALYNILWLSPGQGSRCYALVRVYEQSHDCPLAAVSGAQTAQSSRFAVRDWSCTDVSRFVGKRAMAGPFWGTRAW